MCLLHEVEGEESVFQFHTPNPIYWTLQCITLKAEEVVVSHSSEWTFDPAAKFRRVS